MTVDELEKETIKTFEQVLENMTLITARIKRLNGELKSTAIFAGKLSERLHKLEEQINGQQ